MARPKYPFEEKKLQEKITFSVNKMMREKIEKRCNALHLNTVSDYLRMLISKDLNRKEQS